MGSNFRIDVNNPQTTVGGNDIYNIYSSTDEGDVCLVGYQKDGTYRIYNDKRIEIAAGQTSNEAGVDILISGRSGDVVVTAEKNGRVRIRGKNVIIQADEDVDISAGRNVNLKSGSGRVLVSGNTIEKDGLKGNLLEPEKHWAWRCFEGTGLPGYAFSALTSPFGGVASLASSVLANPASLGSLVDTAVGGAVGGVLGAAGGGLTGVAGGALSSVASGGLGGLADSLTSSASGAFSSAVSNATGGLGGTVANTALSRVRGNLPF